MWWRMFGILLLEVPCEWFPLLVQVQLFHSWYRVKDTSFDTHDLFTDNISYIIYNNPLL